MTDRGGRSNEVADRLGRRFDTDEEQEGQNDQNEQPSDRSDDDERGQRSERSDRSDKSDHSERDDRSDSSANASNNDHSDSSDDSKNSEHSDRVQNVKQEWNGTYIYLPDELDAPFDAEFDRLVYQCGRTLNWKPKKNRHYYPVVIMHGIDAVEEMDAETFRERVDELGLV